MASASDEERIFVAPTRYGAPVVAPNTEILETHKYNNTLFFSVFLHFSQNMKKTHKSYEQLTKVINSYEKLAKVN